MRVALLYGGLSSEREVSLMSYPDFKAALVELGHDVVSIDVGRDLPIVLSQVRPDVAFNALYGTYGEDGKIQGCLDLMGIKYTHSNCLTSAICFNKVICSQLMEAAGIQMPKRVVIDKSCTSEPMKRPYVIKPISEGSSRGIVIVFEEDEFAINDYGWEFGDQAIVEEYIQGRELSVPVLRGKPMGILELIPKKNRFYDYESKYEDDMTEHVVDPLLEDGVKEHVLEMARQAHAVFGCRTISRLDVRYNPALGVSGCFALEINTHPGMTKLSIVPEVCARAGISFTKIIEQLLEDAR